MKRALSFQRNLQLASLALFLLSSLPCLLSIINTPNVIQIAIQRDVNYGLQILFPLCSASMINGIGVLVLALSLFIKDKTDRSDTQGEVAAS
jgi:hypothetical protein